MPENAAGTTTRVSVTPGGAQVDGGSNLPSISGSGQHITFVSNGLLLANVGGYTSYFFQGGILLGAVWFARIVTGKGGM